MAAHFSSGKGARVIALHPAFHARAAARSRAARWEEALSMAAGYLALCGFAAGMILLVARF